MRQTDIDKLVVAVKEKLDKSNIPVNARFGKDEEVREWVLGIVRDSVTADEPVGTIIKNDYMTCPECGCVVGVSGCYCKWCGQLLRDRRVYGKVQAK